MNFNKINKLITFLSFNSMVFSLSFQSFNINDNQANFLLNNFNEKYLINDENNNVCNSPECEEISKYILNYLDTSINPCDDFFQFTCGKWLNENEIPDDKKSIGVFSDGQLQNQEILHEILESNYIPNSNYTLADQENDKIIFNKLKNFYNSCMDTNKINSKGREPLVNFLNTFKINEYKGNLKNVDTLTSLIAEIHNYGSYAFFSMDTSKDPMDPTKFVLTISQDGIGIPSPDLYDDYGVSYLYKDIIKETLEKVFGKESGRDFDAMSESIYKFEHRLARIFEPMENLLTTDKIYNPFTIEYMNKNYPSINWSLYFEKRLSDFGVNNIINDNYVIIDGVPKFTQKLNIILNDTSEETLLYYVEWSLIYTYIDYVADNIKEKMSKAKLELENIKTSPPRYLTCIDKVNNVMGMALGKYYIEKENFNEAAKKDVTELINNIKESLVLRMSELNWLDDTSRLGAFKKASKIEDKTGYPEYIMDPSILVQDFKELDVSSDDFFTLMVNSIRFNIGKKLKSIQQKPTHPNWKFTPSVLNACYDFNENSIFIPSGILHFPFYKYGSPDYINYGGIGAVVGHEMTHGFDTTGKDFDENGKLNNWWSNTTYSEFHNLSQCFIDQYNSYYIEDKNGEKHFVNGKLSVNENIADNAGLIRAYEAWKISMKKHGNKAMEFNKGLPGLTKYTPEQLFFISYGLKWCNKESIEAEIQSLETVDAPSKFNCNGVVSNFQEFAKAFNCPVNSPMNPEKKCLIW